MDQAAALKVAQRFATLSAGNRRIAYEKMSRDGVSALQLPVVRRASADCVPASYAQARQWVLWQLDPLSSAYHICAGLRVQGRFSSQALRAAIALLVSRHEPLRTVFRATAEGGIEQLIQPAGHVELQELDMSGEARDVAETKIAQAARRIAGTPFDLTVGPLFRVALLRKAPEAHVLVVSMHHIVSDGASMQIILGELVEAYRAEIEERAPDLMPLSVQYGDYAVWQRNWLEAGEQERQLAYWRAQLGNEHPVLQLPTDHPRPAQPAYHAASLSFDLPASLVEGLRRRARGQRGTLFITLLAAFQALLYRYTGQADLRIGTTNANRNRPETQGLVGFFVNTQVLRARIDGRMTLSSLLAQVRETVVGAQEHQELPFDRLVEAVQPERTRRESPLFHVLMDHQHRDHRPLAQLPQLATENYELGERDALFELWLNTVEHADGGVSARLSYARELFEPDTISRWQRHYVTLLQAIVDSPEHSVADVNLLEAHEESLYLRRASATRSAESAGLIHRAIEEWAHRAPDATALIHGNVELSYEALNRWSNRIAHRLIARGVTAETRVGLAAERSIEMVVGLLAILKAGGAYVPLDPTYPAERLNHMIRDSGIELLLTQTSTAALPLVAGVESLRIDAADLHEESEHDPRVPLHPDHLAYLIYTSGSTGRPKGAQLCHRNVRRLLQATRDWFHFDAHDVWTLFHSPAFDFSVWEIFGALCHGGQLVIVPYDVSRSPEEFLALLRRHRVTVLNQTPSAFKQLLQVPELYTCSDLALRAVIFGGEALDPRSLRPWIECFGDQRPRLINMYGITETTVHVTYRPVTRADMDSARSPIGEHIPDLGLRVLDAHLNAVPIGVPGELHVAGEGLSRGYLNRAALTAERFIAAPDSPGGERLYRTGDLVRWNDRGELEYLGRIDHQVKVRGFRIELGEIESRLLAEPQVRQAAVIARDGASGTRLIAYVVPAEARIDVALLRERLSAALPEYMLPTAIVTLERLPLNANGKLDRQALPEPEYTDAECYEAPAGHFEAALAAIWSELLGIERIGRHDDFFALGGQSLLAVSLVSRIRRDLAIELRLRTVFENSTLAGMSARLSDERVEDVALLCPIDRAGVLPLAPVQRGLWISHRIAVDADRTVRAAYAITSSLRLTGKLDVPAVRAVLDSIVTRHEVLRTVYPEDDDGDPRAVVLPATPAELKLIDLSSVSDGDLPQLAERWANEAAAGLDLLHGPIVSAKLLRVGACDHILVLAVHHIAFDGWSAGVFVNEFVETYRSLVEARSARLPELPVQYVDYAAWRLRRANGGAAESARRFWKEYLHEAPAQSTLPTDFPRPPRATLAGDAIRMTLSPEVTHSLSRIANKRQVTLFTLLFAAFSWLLHRRLETCDLVIGTDVAGRDHPDIEALIGCFVNVVPLRSRMSRQDVTFGEWLAQTRRCALAAFEHQDVPLDEIVAWTGVPRRLSHNPLVQMLFVQQNTPQSRFELPGLGVEALPSASVASKFDLAVFVQPAGEGMDITWVYAASLYRAATIRSLGESWLELLQRIARPEANNLEVI